jgi:hypothetical protein
MTEPKKKIGILQGKRRLFGWGRELEIVVDGEKFYRRIGLPKEKILEGVREGDRVEMVYEEVRTRLGDWIGDRVTFMGYGIPVTYREIRSIRRA